MMKKYLFFSIKLIISSIFALIVLSVFSLFYSNQPSAIAQPDKITNNRYMPNSYWSYMTEGFGYGKIDSLGYNNAYYRNCTSPDIVFVGSSQLEAWQVPEDSNFIYLLNKKLNEDSLENNNFKCLNLGVSGHFFNVSVSNYKYVAEKYSNAKCIILEAATADFDDDMLDKMINEEYHSDLGDRSMLFMTMRKIPYFRVLYAKLKNNSSNNDADSSDEETDFNEQTYTEKMNIILDNIVKISEKHEIEPVILFRNKIEIDEDNNAKIECDEEIVNVFKKCCSEHGIKVIDVNPRFISHYKETYELPYGFANTVPGNGHLNKVGHELISEELYDRINEYMEK